MEKYGPEVMVASSLFTINSKHLIVAAMKDSLTPHNCLDVWKAIETCEMKYYDNFYSHPALGFKSKCKEIMQTSLAWRGLSVGTRVTIVMSIVVSSNFLGIESLFLEVVGAILASAILGRDVKMLVFISDEVQLFDYWQGLGD